MKKLLIIFVITSGVLMTGCLKDHSNVDFDSSGFIAEISHASITGNNAPSAGLDYLTAATLPPFTSTDPDTITFNVNIASQYPPTKDVSVTVAVDDAKRVAYNSTVDTASGGVVYDTQPDSTFSILSKTLVIKAGTRLATFMVVYYPAKQDPTHSYMLPITLTDASGITISGNLSTIYFHNIGNAFAGTYNWDFTRYNETDTLIPPSGLSFTGHTTTFVPVTTTQFEVRSGYYNMPRYEVTFQDSMGVYTNFKVSLNTDDIAAAFASGGVIFVDGPNIRVADPITKTFIFQYTTASRFIIDKYYK